MKERLTGAIILVALIVLLVPELLTGPPRHKIAGTPPASTAVAGAPVQSYTLPLGAGARAAARRLAAPAVGQGEASAAELKHTASAAPTSTAAPVPTRIVPGPKTKVKPEVRPLVQPSAVHPVRPHARSARALASGSHRHPVRPPTRAAQGPPAGGRWTVQLGVFALHVDALRLARRVRSKGFGVRLAPLRIRGRLLWRVSTPGQPTRAAALHLAQRLRRVGVRGDLLRQ